jgi:hypothetical protein
VTWILSVYLLSSHAINYHRVVACKLWLDSVFISNCFLSAATLSSSALLHFFVIHFVFSFQYRDVFYELLREWEEKHMDPGWTVGAFQSDRIRQLIRCGGSDLTYILHLVRLFLLQLLQVCNLGYVET